MRANLPAAIKLIREHEGGYVDHPSDPGGCTNYGITIGSYRRYVDPKGDCADLKAMDPSTAEQIYANTYWGAVNGDGLPPGIDVMVFDHGVNAGPTRAVKLLQRLLGVSQDGAIGKLTLAAAWEADLVDLIQHYADARTQYYRSLSTWPKFGRGWQARVQSTEFAAVGIAVEYLHGQSQAGGELPSPQVDMPEIDEPIGPAVIILSVAGTEVGRLIIPAGVDAHIEPFPEPAA